MTDRPADRSTHSARLIAAPAEALYRAFVDPAALVEWLPPGRMTGKMHHFDARVGGGYEMSLFYPADETAQRGKSAELEDRVRVRFVALEPPRRIVEAIDFTTDDPALMGEMTMVISFAPAAGGTEVTIDFHGVPPGLKLEENQEGSDQSLAQLAEWIAGGGAPG